MDPLSAVAMRRSKILYHSTDIVSNDNLDPTMLSLVFLTRLSLSFIVCLHRRRSNGISSECGYGRVDVCI